MRRRLVALAILLMVAACSGPSESTAPPRRRPPPIDAETTDPPDVTASPAPTRTPGRRIATTRAPWADGLPALIVSHDTDVNRYRRGKPTLMARVDGTARVAYAVGAATVLVQREFDDGERSELVRARRGGDAQPLDLGRAFITLMDVAVIDGKRSALFTTYHAPEGAEPDGYLYVHDLQANRRRRVTSSAGIEYLMTSASFGGGVIVTSSSADLTEVFQFLRPDGTEVEDPPSPTKDLPYGQPPYLTEAVLSPDGSTLAYLEGPDWDHEAGAVIGDWVLVVHDRTKNRELHRVHVGLGDTCMSRLDFDGRWVVLSRESQGRDDSGSVYCGAPSTRTRSLAVFDTHAEDLELIELTNVVGIATIDD